MSVLDSGAAGAYFDVITESGSQYGVDVDLGACSCPDFQHNNQHCKHLRRVEIILGERALPADVDEDDVDPQLGMHVAGAADVIGADSEPAIATDGGPEAVDVDDVTLERADPTVRTDTSDDDRLLRREDGYERRVEPPEQGSATYWRCTGCGAEIIVSAPRDQLIHEDGCPVARDDQNGSEGDDR